jgi:hypothetical protein
MGFGEEMEEWYEVRALRLCYLWNKGKTTEKFGIKVLVGCQASRPGSVPPGAVLPWRVAWVAWQGSRGKWYQVQVASVHRLTLQDGIIAETTKPTFTCPPASINLRLEKREIACHWTGIRPLWRHVFLEVQPNLLVSEAPTRLRVLARDPFREVGAGSLADNGGTTTRPAAERRPSRNR